MPLYLKKEKYFYKIRVILLLLGDMVDFNKKVINWLLGEDNPPVRYLTYKYLLKQADYAEKTREKLMNYSETREIIYHLSDFLDEDGRAYWKYQGKYWQLIFLSQFLADGNNPSIAALANNIMASRKWIWTFGGQCLAANILAALMSIGFKDHSMVLEETEKLARKINVKKGIDCEVMDYSLLPRCYMAMPKVLLCLVEVPSENRSPEVTGAIDVLVQSLLEHHVYVYVPGNRREWQKVLAGAPKAKDLPHGKTVKGWVKEQKKKFLKSHGIIGRDEKKGWLKFGFPLHYNSDLLEALYALARAQTPMSLNLEMPLDVVRQKMNSDGKWIMENSLNGKMVVDVEQKGQPSKWITFTALRVLDHFTQK